ncbi:MAG: tetratricopeptide repeat protein [Nanoarchaeota archaeon]
MGFLKNLSDKRKINGYLKEYNSLVVSHRDKEATILINSVIKEFSDNFSILYAKIKDLIANQDMKGIEDYFNILQKTPTDTIKSWKVPEVIQTDLIIKDPKDLNDSNLDPIISDEEIHSRKTISTSRELIETIVRRSYYMCLKYNGRNIRGTIVNYPAKKIRFLAELNIKYCQKDKAWVLQWFYKEGMYAVERGVSEFKKGNIGFDKKEYNYAIEILNEYISLTKDNKDDMVHHKFYSRGLAYFNLGKYDLAINDFGTSLKFTKDKALIKDVQEILEESKKRLKNEKTK